MAVTTEQYNRLLRRLTALEEHANTLAVAMDSLVTVGQVNELLVLTKTDLEDLTQQITALDNRLTAVEEEPLS